MARLVIFDESVRGVDLPEQPVVLGRSRTVDVPIRDDILSRRHCSIRPPSRAELKKGASFEVVDLESANGTYINGARVERGALRHDDILEIGNTVIVLLVDESARHPEAVLGLRNPEKARQLIERVRARSRLAARARAARRARAGRGRSPAASTAGTKSANSVASTDPAPPLEPETLDRLEAALSGVPGGDVDPEALRLAEGFVFHALLERAARARPALRRLLEDLVEEAARRWSATPAGESAEGGELARQDPRRDGLRGALRGALEAARSACMQPAPRPDPVTGGAADGAAGAATEA